ncbi:MAG: hypothetical protein PHH60_05280 [Candidatus Margulisbacteria bacterium]|nr:hypothetical protein [Candidatus Margulisiibacteriota bacterium]
MTIRRAIAVLVLSLILAGHGFAAEQLPGSEKPKVIVDRWGNKTSFWLEPGTEETASKIKVLHPHSFKAATLFSTSLEVTAFDITTVNDTLYLAIIANNQIVCSSLPTFEPRVIYASQDNLINLQFKQFPGNPALFLGWQTESDGRLETYRAISLDGGRSFGEAKRLGSSPFPPQPPQVILPAANSAVNSNNLKIVYSASGLDPLLCRIEVSQKEYFPLGGTFCFEQPVPATSREAVECLLPMVLADGTYFLRLSAFDGINTSLPGQVTPFKLDSQPPQFVTLEAQRSEGTITLSGQVSESPVNIQVNGLSPSLETNSHFTCQFTLEAGANLYTFALSDEAGNSLITTQEVFFNPASPEITVIKPDGSDWFKPGSTLIITARVFDLQGDIAEDAEAKIIIDNSLQENTLVFDQEESSLSGFIPLPQDLSDGKHSASVILTDNAGNSGSQDFSINIGCPPPVANQNTVEAAVAKFIAPAIPETHLITNFISGPNPFSPSNDLTSAFSAQGKGMVFSYSLAQPADIKIRIYDITGTLVWYRSISSAASGITAWSGVDQFGQVTHNGIYPYIFSASANGLTEHKKGKIVIIN